jgi:membrane-anchored protein YejM (alkaline phosphatase superfamily)
VAYGLGTENQNLPGFIALGAGQPLEGVRQYGSGFLPTSYQATFISNLNHPINNLRPAVDSNRQRSDLDALQNLNRLHAEPRADDERLNARIASFELAYRMQAEAPQVFDLGKETEATKRLYGIGIPASNHFSQECLLARRLVEHGVRFVQIFDTLGGNFQPWDLHGAHNQGLRNCAARTDRPIAGLLKDLKQRGLLEDTLVIWGGEFGRTPRTIQDNGTDHHPYGFSMWLAGGGVRGGFVHGATDERGHHAVENRVHVHDLHATILHLLGLDHERLTYRYAGRDFRLTDVSGNIIRAILS